jgi:hypothetical protein
MKLIGPGGALVLAREDGWISGKKFVRWEEAGADLEANSNALRTIREVVRSPVLRMPLQYSGVRTRLPHLAAYKKGAQWLSVSSIYNIHTGDINSAINDIESIVWLAQPLRDEPILISQLVRIALVAIPLSDCWPILQADGISEEQLVRLQHALEGLELAGGMVFSLQGERVMSRDAIHELRIRTSSKEIADTLGSLAHSDESTDVLKHVPYNEEIRDTIRAAAIVPLWRFVWSYEDERHMLEEMEALLKACEESITQHSVVPLHDADRQFARKSDAGGPYQSWHYWVTSTLMGAIMKAPLRACRFETQRELTITAIALKRYQLRHGKYPKGLDELVPEFLREVPVDWMDGQKLRYRPEGEKFVLWSVGDDGKDDGGTPDQTDPYSFWNGKDFVWPQPASDAEVSAYSAKMKAHR